MGQANVKKADAGLWYGGGGVLPRIRGGACTESSGEGLKEAELEWEGRAPALMS